jgi:hypothetical protein
LVVLTAALSGSAHAAFFSSVWDPKFGAPFVTDLPFGAPYNLGWRATDPLANIVEIPDGCLPVGTATIDNAIDCDGAAKINAAQVELYNFDLGSNAPAVATLTFNPASMVISDMRFVDGELRHLTTTNSNFVDPPESLWQFGVAWDVEFSLFFTFDVAGFADGPHLSWRQPCGYHHASYVCYRTGVSNPDNDPALVPNLKITRVPEPSSLALALVGVLGLASRRARRSLLWAR